MYDLSFRISRKKMVQHDLRAYGPLRLFDLGKQLKNEL
jgi:hypothetical protein